MVSNTSLTTLRSDTKLSPSKCLAARLHFRGLCDDDASSRSRILHTDSRVNAPWLKLFQIISAGASIMSRLRRDKGG